MNDARQDNRPVPGPGKPKLLDRGKRPRRFGPFIPVRPLEEPPEGPAGLLERRTRYGLRRI